MAKIIIIGAGHNGLVAACYLAACEHEVEVFERSDTVGGCATTDETTFPRFKISSASYVNSLFLPQIVEDLNLRKYGYEVLLRNPSSFTPLPNGKHLFLGANMEENVREISRFSKKDAKAYPKYEEALEKIATLANSMMTITPPDLSLRTTISDVKTIAQLVVKLIKLGPVANMRLFKLLTQDARKFLDSWFESDELKATLLPDAAIGAPDFSGYVLLHHVMGEAGGARGIWGYQRGGMGGVSKALASAAYDLGVKIHTMQPVEKVILSMLDGSVRGVCLENGVKVHADVVVSNADPKTTFTKLVPKGGEFGLKESFVKRVNKIDFASPVMKINLTLSGLPNFRCLPGVELGSQHMGTIHIAPSVDYISKARGDYLRGIPSEKPVVEITIPSSVDDTLAPPGRHVMSMFIQYVPYHRSDGKQWNDATNVEYFEENVLGAISPYISNMHDIIKGVEILSPVDLERRFGLTGGNIFHGGMGLGQLFSFRPLRGYADYHTPIKGLYNCGAGTHPGGGVTGACGYNAAREVIADLESEKVTSDVTFVTG